MFKGLVEKIMGKKVDTEKLTEKDLDTMKPAELYEIALHYKPEDREKIDDAYKFLKEYGDSPSMRTRFITWHITPYIRK
jgi:hypothetical protein